MYGISQRKRSAAAEWRTGIETLERTEAIMTASLRVQFPLWSLVNISGTDLAKWEEDAFEEGTWFIERLFNCHVEMVIQLFIFCDVVTNFIEEDIVQETMIRNLVCDYR